VFRLPASTREAATYQRSKIVQSGADISAEVNPQGASFAPGKTFEVTLGLSVFEYAEAIGCGGDREVVCVVGSDLQEDATIGSTFVQLPRGVEEAWSVAQGCRHFAGISNRVSHRLKRGGVFVVHLDVGIDGEVVASADASKVSRHDVLETYAADGSRVSLVCVHGHPAGFKDRRFGRE
jgi:hypothetical protein